MSIASELNNYRNGLEDAYDAVSDMSGTIPTDRNMNNLDDAIRTIPISSPNDGVLTITQNGTTVQTFSANQATNVTAALTDTTYSDFTGATSSVAGAAGLVPAPTTADPDKYLKGDGSWGTPTDTTYTAGNGIGIANDTISVDTSVVATQTDLGNYVTLSTNQNITGEKTFVGNKRIKFKGTASNSKLGFTTFDQNNGENGFFEVEGASTASKKVRLGCYDQAGGNARDNYVGFQYHNTKPGGGGGTVSYNLVCPPRYRGVSGTNTFAYIPVDFTDGNTTIRADNTGVLNLSTLLPSYSGFTGATSSTAGTEGLVPAPAAGDEEKFLKGDGTWASPVVATASDYLSFDSGVTVNELTATKFGPFVNVHYDIAASLVAGENVVGSATNKVSKTTYGAGRVTDWNNNTQGTASIVVIPSGAVRIYASQAGTASAGDVWFFEV